MGKKVRNEKGFTLVEILIVVIILAILAGVVIPQFSSSSDEAKLSVLQSDLATLRGAAELYYHQHNSTYPGAASSNYAGSPDTPEAYFVDQLTLYSDVDGNAVVTKTATHKYGPYIKKGIPVNPFNDLNTVEIDIVEDDLTAAAADGGHAWKFYSMTGQLFADDGGHDTY